MPSDCPNTHRLRGLLEQTASNSETTLLTAHLDHCRDCQRQLEALAGAVELPRGDLSDATAPSAALERAIDQLNTNPSPSPGAATGPGPKNEDPGLKDAALTDTNPADVDQAARPSFLGQSDKPGYIGRFGSYEVLRVLGRGGMGVVLKVYDAALERHAAVKVLLADLAANENARRRFAREAKAAAAVDHDNVITIHHIGESSGLPYLVMPYVSGGSLERLIRTSHAPLSVDEITRIGRQIAAGLSAAHDRGLTHRDIKPANILLEDDGRKVKLADFGLARAGDELAITRTGMIAGTPQYMAPEQAMGQRVDHRTDLFSLGAVLYTLCTGRPPFSQASVIAAIRGVCDETPRSIQTINPSIPPWMIELIERLMAKDPDQRIQTAAEVVAWFDRPPNALPVTLAPNGKPNHPRPRSVVYRWAMITVTAIGATIVALALWVTDGKPIVTQPHPDPRQTNRSGFSGVASSAPTRSSSGAAPPAVPVEDRGFIVLSRDSGKRDKYDSLSEAVAATQDGDTIEVGWDGPLTTEPIQIQGKSLVFRAQAGCRPVLESDLGSGDAMISTDSALVLEGLAFEYRNVRVGLDDDGFDKTDIDPQPDTLASKHRQVIEHLMNEEPSVCLIRVAGSLYAANCRFWLQSPPGVSAACITRDGPHALHLVNSEFYLRYGAAIHLGEPNQDGPDAAGDDRAQAGSTPASPVVISHCVQTGLSAVSIAPGQPQEIFLTNNTLAGVCVVTFSTHGPAAPGSPASGLPHSVTNGALTIRADHNVFDVRSFLITPAPDPVAMATDLIQWFGQPNLFSICPLATPDISRRNRRTINTHTIAAWKRFLGAYAAGTVRAKVVYAQPQHPTQLTTSNAPRGITPEAFKIKRVVTRSGRSAAPPSDTQFGAAIDRVGPGGAYERYKHSTAYLQWCETISKDMQTRPR